MQRSILAFAMVVALAGAGAGRADDGVDVAIENPGMEGTYRALGDSGKVTGEIASGWSDNSSWAEIAVAYANDPANPHGGVAAQRVTVSDVRSGAVQFVQSVKLLKGHEYVLRGWLRGTPDKSVTLMLRKTSGEYLEYASATPKLTEHWQEVTAYSIRVAEDADALLMARADSPVTFWIDDVRLTDVTPAPAAGAAALVPIKNPGFEGTYRDLGATGKVTGSIADGWSDNSNWADIGVAYAADTENPHGGATAQRVTVTAVRSGLVQMVQGVRVQKDHAYAFKVWLRGSPGTVVSLAIRQTGAPSTEYAGTTAALSGEWQEFKVFGNVTDDTDALLMIRASAPMTFWVDDVRFEDLTSASAALQQERASAAVLKNPGMEGAYRDLGSTGKVTGQLAPGWADNSSWADVELSYAPDTGNPHRGTTAQRIDVKNVRNGAVHMVQDVHLQQGRVYAFKVWMRGSPGTMAALALRKPGPPYTEYAGAVAALSAEWQEFKVYGAIPEDTAALAMIKASAPMSFWVDDASLEDVTEAQSGGARTGNLVNGGSFEAGPSFGWSVRTKGAMRNRFADPRPQEDRTTAAVGAASLRCVMAPDDDAEVRSPVLELAGNAAHTVSLWMKSDVPALHVHGTLEKTGISSDMTVGTNWTRFTFGGKTPFLPHTRLRLTSRSPGGAAVTLWLDGVQVEAGSSASAEYQAPYALDVRLGLNRPGHVVHDGEAGDVVTVRVAPEPPAGAVLRLSATDIYGKTFAVDDVALPAESFPLPVLAGGAQGVFKLRGELQDATGKALAAPVDLVWSRLPAPREIDPRKSFFGLHIVLCPDYVALARAVGIRWARLHDASMIAKWGVAEVEPGKWEFCDDAVTATHAAGMAILGMFDGAPSWVATQPREGGYWGVWHIPDKPGALEHWDNYVRTVATHYKGRIDDWEVWNEPWGRWFMEAGGKPELYGQLTCRAYGILKEINPDARLIAIDTYRGRDEWTTNALAATGTACYDGFSFHDYNDAIYGGPDPLPQSQARTFNAYQAAVGTPKPLWDTEGGAGDLGSFYAPVTGGMPVQLQPTFIVRHDVTYMAAGIQACFLYAAHSDPGMGDTSFQTTEWDRAVKPVLAARAVLAKLVDGVGVPVRTELEPGLEMYTFPAENGNVVRVAWSYDGNTHAMAIPAGARVLDVFGNAVAGAASPLNVTTEPVYFVGPAGI